MSVGCQLLGISRQAYYKQQKSLTSKHSQASKVISLVEEVRIKMPRIGTRKMYYLLKSELEKMNIGRDKLFRILKANHMLIKPHRSYHITTQSHHRYHKHKDLVNNIEITRPEQVWVSDITYIGHRTTHRYLALITDAYSKKIVGYDLSESLSADSAIRALNMAVKQRMYNQVLIHHSDRGLQYCCDAYQELLSKNKLKVSMTEKYDPYANAIAERINGILKQEFLLEEYNCNIQTLNTIVKESVQIYNNNRPHLSCNMLTPEQMHKQQILTKPKYSKTKSANKMLADSEIFNNFAPLIL